MKMFFVLCLTVFSSIAIAGSKLELAPDRTIVLSGPITSDMYRPTVDAMDRLGKSGKLINVIISSPGGEVITGSFIIDRMEQLKAEGIKFRCVVRDLAASMAFQILLHCSERYATPHSFLLWHPVRMFMQGIVTADLAQILATQLAAADQVALHDLRAYLPMPEEDLIWHFQNETLHQAINLKYLSPTFFIGVTNNISNLHPVKPELDTSSLSARFSIQTLLYIHERFVGGLR